MGSTSEATKKRHKANEQPYNFNQMGKLPPQATDLEQAVLGAVMLEGNSIVDVKNILKPFHFYKDEHVKILNACYYLFDNGKPVDILTVTNHLRNAGELELVGGAFYITELANRVASSANIEFWCQIILEKWMQRELIVSGANMVRDAYEDQTDVIQLVDGYSNKLTNIMEGVVSGHEKTAREMAMEAIKYRDTMKPTDLLGLSWGSQLLDKATSGLIGGNLYIIAGRPGMGKTTFGLNVVKDVLIRQKKKVAFFSLEMVYKDLFRKLESIVSEIDGDKIKKNNLTTQETERLLDADAKLADTDLLIDDKAAAAIGYIRTRGHILKRKNGLDLIMIDYLQLMSDDGDTNNREQEISKISRGLKQIGKELNVPVIAFSQLTRSVEATPDKIPLLSHLRESGSIEQDADVVIFLWRPEYYNLYEQDGVDFNFYGLKGVPTDGLLAAIIAKQRDGDTYSIPMKCDLAKSIIKDHPHGLGNYGPELTINDMPGLKPNYNFTESIREQTDDTPF